MLMSTSSSLSHKSLTVYRLFLLTALSYKMLRVCCSVSGKMVEVCFSDTPYDSISKNLTSFRQDYIP